MSADATPSTQPLGAARAFKDTRRQVSGGQRALRLVLRNPIGALVGLIVALVILTALVAGLSAPYDPVSQLARPLEPPSATYPLGVDELGRDVLSRVIHGARVSLYVGIVSVAIALVSGSILGLLAGYYG